MFSIPLRTVNNTKTQENASVCTGPKLLNPYLGRFNNLYVYNTNI